MYFSVSDTGILGKRKFDFSQQESNLRSSDYKFRCSTTELQETRGSLAIKLGSFDKHPTNCKDLNVDGWYMWKKCDAMF